jgi:1-acyl-sn-glycerol-3-phosphate acyltransferase
MKIVISLILWPFFIFITAVLFFVILFFSLVLFPFDKKRKVAHAQCFWWSDAVIGVNPFWRLKVKGLENIDPKRTYVVVANHQSIADIAVIYQTRMQFKWVAKESLFKVPFVGWSLFLTKNIKLQRGKLTSIKNAYREAGEWLKNNMSVLFFPEGTRSHNGEMSEFQNGAFKLAIKEKIPILPISITGTRDALPKHSWIFTNRVSGKLTVHSAIETDDFKVGEFNRLKDLVREQISVG